AGAAALTKGAYKIDGKILEVRDGAAKIFEGLVKLSEGSRKLETGLVDSAAPGAQKLADGAGQLADGTGQLKDGTGQLAPGAKQLADGAGQLAAGAGQLKDGTGQLAPGARQLADGTGQLATGAGQLASGSIALAVGSGDLAAGAAELSEGIGLILQGVEMLPAALAADPGFQALKGALTQVQAGIGNPTDVSPTTLLGGINLIKYGLRSPLGVAGCDQTAAPGTPTACAIGDGLEIISGRQAAAAAPGGSLDLLIGAAKAAYVGSFLPDGTTPCPTDATVPVPPVVPPSLLPDGTVCDAVSNVVYGLGLPAGVLTSTDPGGVKAQTALSADKLKAMYQGIDAQIIPGLNGMALGLSNPGWDTNSNGKVDTGEKPGVKEVQGLVSGGLDQLVQGISDSLSGFLSAAHEGSVLVAGGAELVAGGTAQVAAGAGKLADGSSAVAAGAGKLSDGATKLDAGAGKLADGSTKVAAGAGKLSDGAAKLDVGAGKLDDGAGKLADGAGQLADGLQDAGDGSTQIADGVDQVKDGVGQLKDGANRLSGEGSSLLAGSANDAATSTARKAALLTAMAAKAEDGAMPYGLPDGAVGDAAFSYTLAGANSDAEESTLRGGAALALLALGSLSAFVVRRRVTA
ncbi:MAG TPA: hypothetical protein VNU26_13150, partial [Mycobacteriales bacterium]|nr:hypothetical protein [Mycobacteriales bacterium]